MNTCTNCGNQFEGKFCNQCGQKLFTESDKSIWHIVTDAFHFITHFEGSFFTSIRHILLQPGRMSLDYCSGMRKRYFRPVSLYLLVVVIYLLSPLARGLNMSLDLHLGHPFYGILATKQLESKFGSNHDRKLLAEGYHRVSSKVSKVLLLVLIPLVALLLRLLFFWKKRALFDFFILAVEINIIYVLLFFLLIPVFFGLMGLAFHPLLEIFENEDSVLPILFIIFFTYTFFMFRRFFSVKWYAAIPLALVFPFLFFLTDQLIYRFLLFEISLALL